jgi:hypothetical protein
VSEDAVRCENIGETTQLKAGGIALVGCCIWCTGWQLHKVSEDAVRYENIGETTQLKAGGMFQPQLLQSMTNLVWCWEEARLVQLAFRTGSCSCCRICTRLGTLLRCTWHTGWYLQHTNIAESPSGDAQLHSGCSQVTTSMHK